MAMVFTNCFDLDFEEVVNKQFFDLEKVEPAFNQDVTFTMGSLIMFDTIHSMSSMKRS